MNSMDVTTPKRVAIVTGAASGIGKSIAIRLAQDGFNLALNDLADCSDKLQQVAQEASKAGVVAIPVTGDVSSEADVRRLVDVAVEKLGGVDAMVANAGIAGTGPLVDITTEQWDRMFAVHARGAFLCYKYAIQQMIKQGRGGRVIGACSVFGKKAGINCAHYSAAKFAIRGLTQAAAQEVGQHGITVNAYAPGFIKTPMVDGLSDSMRSGVEQIWKEQGYEPKPEDVANVVSFLLADKSHHINGQTIAVSGGWHVLD